MTYTMHRMEPILRPPPPPPPPPPEVVGEEVVVVVGPGCSLHPSGHAHILVNSKSWKTKEREM